MPLLMEAVLQALVCSPLSSLQFGQSRDIRELSGWRKRRCLQQAHFKHGINLCKSKANLGNADRLCNRLAPSWPTRPYVTRPHRLAVAFPRLFAAVFD